MKIIVNERKIIKMVKSYYQKEWNFKRCKVKIDIRSIRNKLQEIDLVHYKNFYYNILFCANVKGKVYGNTCIDTLDSNAVKNIIAKYYGSSCSIDDVEISCNCINDMASTGIEFNKICAIVNKNDVKNEKKLIKKNRNF